MVPLAGPLIFATLYLINLPLDQKQQSFLAVFCFVVYNWLIARIPLFATGLTGVGLSIILGVEDPIKALSSFAHPIIFIFLAGFLFAKALRNNLFKNLRLKALTNVRAFLFINLSELINNIVNM